MASDDEDLEQTIRSDKRADPVLPRGAALGRYLVLERIGSGGMGVVYAAYDPQLNRKVAIKMVRPKEQISSPEAWQNFVLREARVMARLSHPNVISVYDVGTIEGEVFIAMELVEGGTLREWLKADLRTWRDIVSKFLAAGEGLKAAHQAGLLHRDFKPDNVLVARDGRVFVTDFGLVRSSSQRGHEVTSPTGEPSSESQPETLFLGTPKYMAPEQFVGGAVDERADVFSFCVALFEALYGERPFPGDDTESIVRAALKGAIASPPPPIPVPRVLRRALVKGLSPRPADRWPSMQVLLDRLHSIVRMRGRVLLTLILLLTFGLPAALTIGFYQRQQRLCQGAEADLQHIWDADRRAAIHQAFTKTGLSYAQDSWRSASAALDAYAAQWVQMRVGACEDTLRHMGAPDATWGLRMQCLDDRLRALDAVGQLFSGADNTVVERAAETARDLPALGACADLFALGATPPPPGAAAREEVALGRARLIQARMMLHSAKYQEGLMVAERVRRAGEDSGYLPLVAEALVLQATFQEKLGNYPDAAATLRQAVRTADETRDDRSRAEALVESISVQAKLVHHADAEALGEDARAALKRVPGSEAEEAHRMTAIGRLYRYQGRWEQAEGAFREALAMDQRVLGPDHPATADVLNALGVVLTERWRTAEALQAHQESLAIRRRVFGNEHPAVAESLLTEQLTLVALGRYAEAETAGKEALAIDEKAFRPDHPHVATALATLAATEIALGKYGEAHSHLDRALAIREKALGAESPSVAYALSGLAQVAAKEGRWDDAQKLYERALAIRQKVLGADHPMTGVTLLGLGAVRREQGKPRDAQGLLERAVGVFSKTHTQAELAQSEFELAKAFLDQHQPQKATTQVQSALEHLPPQGGAITRDDLEGWLKKNALLPRR